MKETVYRPANSDENIETRKADVRDEPFLVEVYASARAEELARVPCDEKSKQAFIAMQFAAQVQHYRTHYPGAQQLVICANGRPVGRLYLNRGPEEFRILDIAVLHQYRKRGIGTGVLRSILKEASSVRLPVTIYVEFFNPSLAFFEQLGFRRTKQDEVNVLMRWDPEDRVAGKVRDITKQNG